MQLAWVVQIGWLGPGLAGQEPNAEVWRARGAGQVGSTLPKDLLEEGLGGGQ